MKPVLKTFPLDFPAERLLDIFRNEKSLVLLHSSLKDFHRGRFSFFAFNPFKIVSLRGKNALEELRQNFIPFRTDLRLAQTPLSSGIIGYISYDYGLYQERIKLKMPDEYHLPDVHFNFYDTIVAVDHFKKKIIIVSTGVGEKTSFLRKAKALEASAYIIKKLGRHRFKDDQSPQGSYKGIKLKSNFGRAAYLGAVRRALKHIERGDIYQVNLSQRFTFDLRHDAFDPIFFYQSLIKNSPGPFSGYLDAGRFQIMSSSPERFLSLSKNKVVTSPMKGTRPRGKNLTEDKRYKKEISLSAKDKAELLMVTDLERNDLGRVCDYGTVKVRDMRTIETYKTVYQATSTIEGLLRKDKDEFDLIKAAFPGGSITGCPKIRAMEIIEDLENCRRGIYTGILGYIDFNGDMDFNILIRTVLRHKNKLYFQTGGGIVSDSKPQKEYSETLIKAKGILETLKEF